MILKHDWFDFRSKADGSSKGINLLSGEGDGISSSSEESDDNDDQPPQQLDNPFANKKRLPNPLASNKVGTKGSVFVTDYQLAEASKDSILEQHVKMTEAPNLLQKTIGGKKVCWNYRKMGRCNKGHKCPYAHDTDLVSPSAATGAKSPSETSSSRGGSMQYSYHGNAPAKEPVDDDSYMGQAKKRKRVGVTDNLIPPKKALNALNKSRQQERPWTQ